MTKIIDLSAPKRKPEEHDPEPEEIVMAVIAVVLWTVIIIGCMGAF